METQTKESGMKSTRSGWMAALVATMMAGTGVMDAHGRPAEAPMTVREPAGVARANEWVTVGVPFARGALPNVAGLRALQDGHPIRGAQFRTLSPWPDGSVQWALATFPLSVPADGEVGITVAAGSERPQEDGLRIEETEAGITVQTGVLEARIDKQDFRILNELSVRGRPVIRQGEESGAVLELPDGQKLNMAAHPPTEVTLEEAGPYRAVVMARGRFPGAMQIDGAEMVRWTCRLIFHAGSDIVRVHYTLGNDGAYGTRMRRREYFQFNSLALHFDMRLGAGVEVVSAEANGSVRQGAEFAMRQKGANRGDGPIFEAALGDETLETSDARSTGALAAAGTGNAFSVALRDYWQNYPKETVMAHNRLTLALWPAWGGFPEGHDVYNLCGGKQKTHEIAFRFGQGGLETATELAAMLNRPLMPLAAPEYYADTKALVLLSPAGVETGNEALDENIRRYDELQRSKPAGLTEAADSQLRGNYYNWMNWGDLFWAWGSSSLHYDWTHIMLAHFLRTGQRDFFDWGSAMARHQYDIDIHRSPRDQPAFRYLSAYEKEERGGSGWHVSTNPGSMLPIPSHNWIQGQTLYALLTGDPESWEGARINAEGIRSRMFGVHNLDESPRRGQPRTYGWSIECLVALYALTGDEAYLDDSRKIFENGLWHMFTDDGNTTLEWGGLHAAYCVRPLIDYHWHTGDERALQILQNIADVAEAWEERFEYFMLGDAAAYVYYRTGEESYLEQARTLLGELLNQRGSFNNRSGAWTKSEAKTSRSAYKHIAIERLKTLGRTPGGE